MQIDQCKKSENEPQSSTKQEPSKTVFNYSEFSFNLLLKFCHEYHVCRAEFGRVGGLNKYLTKIEAINSQITTKKDSANNLSKETLRTYGKLIEMICFNCKESVNRLRLKEQGHLSKLVKHQQDLKAEKLKAILKQYNEKSLQELCSDSSIHNKLLVAMCCFAHDQDSMNILLSNGLVDALLGKKIFLKKSYSASNKSGTSFIQGYFKFRGFCSKIIRVYIIHYSSRLFINIIKVKTCKNMTLNQPRGHK